MAATLRGNTDWFSTTYPAYAQLGDLVICFSDPAVTAIPDFQWAGRAFFGAFGIGVHWRYHDGTEDTTYADGESWWVFVDAQIGFSNASQGNSAPIQIPDVVVADQSIFLWACEAQNNLDWDIPASQPPYYTDGTGAVDGTQPRAAQMRTLTTGGVVGGELLSVAGGVGASRHGIVAIEIRDTTVPPPDTPPVSTDFEFWPGRHVRTIDVARKLKSHSQDPTRHLNLSPNNETTADTLDFLVYSPTLGYWAPLAPFVYGDLAWDYDGGAFHPLPAAGTPTIIDPPDATFGPHYLVDEPANGQMRYTGADLRTARIQATADNVLTANNTTLTVGLYVNGTLAFERTATFSGTAVGAVAPFGIDGIINLNTGDTFDVRYESNNDLNLYYFQLQIVGWPRAAGEIATP